MANTYTWTFQNFEISTLENGYQDVVTEIWWAITANDGLGHAATCSGSSAISYDINSTFVPFSKITPAIAEGWVTSALGVPQINALQAQLDQSITAQVTPQVVSVPPPWSQ